MQIIGAGMAGCLAGVINPNSMIYEAAPKLPETHQAVLRFRTDTISRVTGIPFRKVTVRKAIWMDRAYHQPSIRVCNLYSKKVLGLVNDRSIWDIDAKERFIAPSDFHARLADRCKDRIIFGSKITAIRDNEFDVTSDGSTYYAIPRDKTGVIVSTMPMNIMSNILRINIGQKFTFKNIKVDRFKIKGADVFQTVYYPDLDTPIYRATLTGDVLIVESVGDSADTTESYWNGCLHEVFDSFGLRKAYDAEVIGVGHKQEYGKISPIDDKVRKQFIIDLTRAHRIYSLGRFACWRNILMDDVYEDVLTIKGLIEGDEYSRSLKLGQYVMSE